MNAVFLGRTGEVAWYGTLCGGVVPVNEAIKRDFLPNLRAYKGLCGWVVANPYPLFDARFPEITFLHLSGDMMRVIDCTSRVVTMSYPSRNEVVLSDGEPNMRDSFSTVQIDLAPYRAFGQELWVGTGLVASGNWKARLRAAYERIWCVQTDSLRTSGKVVEMESCVDDIDDIDDGYEDAGSGTDSGNSM